MGRRFLAKVHYEEIKLAEWCKTPGDVPALYHERATSVTHSDLVIIRIIRMGVEHHGYHVLVIFMILIVTTTSGLIIPAPP
jgi:hypothetical protein